MQKPSQSILVYLFICFVGIVTFGFYQSGIFSESTDSKNNNKKSVVSSKATSTPFEDLSGDSDGDGLKNWEESLWKTDPGNKDSDGDGVVDGEEVAMGHSPTIKGPNDSLLATSSEIGGDKNKKITATDKFSRTFFARYIRLKQAGINIDESATNQLVDDIINKDYAVETLENIAIKDIRVINNNSPVVLKDYGNALGTIIKKGGEMASEQELLILQEYIEKGEKFEEFERFDPIIAKYSYLLEWLKKVKVPKDLAIDHLSLLNGLNGLMFAVQGMREMETDPVGALLYTENYEEYFKKMVFGIEGIQKYLDKEGIVFGDNEAGNIILK